jgi:Arc-like DNA binding domain
MSKKTEDVVVTLRLPRELYAEIREVAKANDRAASAEIRVATRRHVLATKEASAERAAA